MEKILVPCDFSKHADDAFRFALDMATECQATVYLLHVIELPIMYDSVLMPPLYFEENMIKILAENAEKEFVKITKKYKKEHVKVVTKVEFGVITKSIIDFVGDQGINLIVMGSQGVSGLKEHFIGSNAERIVRNSKVPVLVIKNYFKGPIKNIVFPNTLETENQEDLILKVKALQNIFKAKLHIVWINTPTNFTSDSTSYERLNAFAKRFILTNFTTSIYNDYFEEDGILKFTKSIDGDLIAMGTHGRKGISHLFSGSLTEDVVNHGSNLIWTYLLKN